MTEMTKEELRAKLDELGIEHDGRANMETLIALLPNEASEASPEPEQAAEETPEPEEEEERFPFMVKRDFWNENGDRVRKGKIVEMRAVDALDGMASGAIEKAF